jgi:hypothetical protein
MEKAEEKNDTKNFDALVARASSLEEQLGPDYTRVIDGLGEVDPTSEEGQKYAAVFEPLNKQCGPAHIRT